MQAEAAKTFDLEGTGLKKTDVYQRRNFYILMAPKDGSIPVKINVYNASLNKTFEDKRTLKLSGLVKRDDILLYVQSSKSSYKARYQPTKEQLDKASLIVLPDSSTPLAKTSTKRKLSEALADENASCRSTVVAKVVKVG